MTLNEEEISKTRCMSAGDLHEGLNVLYPHYLNTGNYWGRCYVSIYVDSIMFGCVCSAVRKRKEEKEQP